MRLCSSPSMLCAIILDMCDPSNTCLPPQYRTGGCPVSANPRVSPAHRLRDLESPPLFWAELPLAMTLLSGILQIAGGLFPWILSWSGLAVFLRPLCNPRDNSPNSQNIYWPQVTGRHVSLSAWLRLMPRKSREGKVLLSQIKYMIVRLSTLLRNPSLSLFLACSLSWVLAFGGTVEAREAGLSHLSTLILESKTVIRGEKGETDTHLLCQENCCFLVVLAMLSRNKWVHFSLLLGILNDTLFIKLKTMGLSTWAN